MRGIDHYGPKENHTIGKKTQLPSWALLLNMLMQGWGSALGTSAWDLFPEAQITKRGSQNSWIEAGHPPTSLTPHPHLENCREGDNRNRLKGWDWWPLMELRIKRHSTKGPLIHPPFSFRCSSAPGLAPDRKHNTHLTGRVFA